MKTITFKGAELPCRVTMGAMVRFKRESGKDVSEMTQNDVADLVLFLWCCVASACNADGIDFDVSFDRFADSLEPEALAAFCEGMNEENGQKKTGKGNLPRR